MIKEAVKKLFNILGFHIEYYPKLVLKSRIDLINTHNIKTIIDVGANKGQYAKEMRELGFKGDIISFEPLKEAYSILAQESNKDKKWYIHNFALGSSNEVLEINVASNLASSSILEMEKSHIEALPYIKYVSKEKINLRQLDNVWNDLIAEHPKEYYLKIDTQGFENEVLKGSENVLAHIKGIQLEMSLTTLYSNEWLFDEMYDYLKKKGYQLSGLEPQFYDTNGKLLQMDGIFYKE